MNGLGTGWRTAQQMGERGLCDDPSCVAALRAASPGLVVWEASKASPLIPPISDP